MITHLVFGIICVLLASLSIWVNGRWRRAPLVAACALMFAFLALRLDFGNDYGAYYDGFLSAPLLGLDVFTDYEGHFEIAWLLLCMIFQPFGFFTMVACLSLFQVFVVYRFISRYVPPHFYWLGIFIYVFWPDNMLIQLSAMRQATAAAVFVLSLDYLLKRQTLKYLLVIGIASLFHSSAVLAILLVALVYFPISNRVYFGGLLLGYFMLYAAGEWIAPFIAFIVDGLFPRYQIYQDNIVFSSGLGFVVNASILLIIAYSGHRGIASANELLVRIAALGYWVMPLALVIMMLGRLNMYFQMVAVAALPLVVANIDSRSVRYSFLISYVSFVSYCYLSFFNMPIYFDKYQKYHTIFKAGLLGF